MMDKAAEALEAQFAEIRLAAPKLRCISSVTGDWLTEAEATSPAYWAGHCRAPVRFGDGLSTLFRHATAEGRTPILIETGPGITRFPPSRVRAGRGAAPPPCSPRCRMRRGRPPMTK
ncbi:hypothetical protein RZS28_10275 [Methylocapsa polymorpha]|uniref:Uncharacterized protein n=1 Tax=Methylocapsa polymorpha TaxID=3080828 RepID=A0ABZ0HPA0_9HYPH|nr:hypothetical protein RZS28_10275 [Methylocapsa sp. RX1]